MESAYLKALKCEPVDHIPVWFMRQAGRYMKDFRNLREKYSFLELVHTPELAAEVTMQPIRSFGMDAAIIFSDILVLADAFDLDFTYVDKLGPKMGKKLSCTEDLRRISLEAVEEKLDYVFAAIKCAKQQLKHYRTPLIGFCGAPFTLASYCVGEEFHGDDKKALKWFTSHQPFMHEVLEFITQASIKYLKGQIRAGADALQIFESWNSWLSWTSSRHFSVHYINKIIQGVKSEYKEIPITVFGTANSSFYTQFSDSQADAISFDAKINLSEARAKLPSNMAVQGNLDSYFLFADKRALLQEVDRILLSMQGQKGFIFNLGHGVMPETSEEIVRCVVERVQTASVLN